MRITMLGIGAASFGALGMISGVYVNDLRLVCAGSALLLCVFLASRSKIISAVEYSFPKKAYIGKGIDISCTMRSNQKMLQIVKSDFDVRILQKGRAWSISGQWKPKSPGKITLPPITLRVVEKFGFFEFLDTVIPNQQILVLPRNGSLPMLKRSIFSRTLGAHRSKILGGTDEFLSLREYVPGDDLRLIDWKATARTDQYHVREMIGYKKDKVLVLADMSENSYYGGFLDKISEHALEISLSRLAVKDSVGLVLFSSTPSPVPLSSSSAHYESIMHALSTHKFGGKFDMLAAARLISAYYPAGMKVYILASATDALNLEKGIDYLISSRHKPFLFSYFEPYFSQKEDPISLGAQQLVYERSIEISRRLRKKGVRCELIGPATRIGSLL